MTWRGALFASPSPLTIGVGVVRAIRVDSHSRGLRSNVGAGPHSGSGWQLIRQHVRLAHSDERNGRRSAAACGVAFSGASHRPHSSGACPPRGQSSGPLSPESPRPLCATQVPGPVVLQPRRLPTPSRSGDLWMFFGAPPGSSTLYDLGELGFPVGCRGHEHLRVRVVRTPPTTVRAHRRENPANWTPSVQFRLL